MSESVQLPAAPRVKPLLRGVSHEIAAVVAFAGGLALVRAASGPRGRIAALVYGLSLFALFTISGLYHGPWWSERIRGIWRRLDHAAIFVLIAGTYTPICLLVPTAGGLKLLAAVWIAALAGAVFSVLWPRAPRALFAAIYVAVGWMVTPVLPALARTLGTGGIALLAGGGIAYSVGALIYALRRPDPFPTVFGYHEVFHVLVIVAAAFHYVAVMGIVAAI